MIGRLRGLLLEKRPPWLVLEAGGVGYEVEAPMTVFYALPEPGAEILLHTHLVVREDAQLLYGFRDRFERELFRALLRVNGVGPRMALGILSGIEATRLAACIREQDSGALVKIPGVGRKTAERLVMEMADRLERLDGVPAASGAAPAAAMTGTSAVTDALAALEALGYRSRDAERALAGLEDGLASEELIRRALQSLAK